MRSNLKQKNLNKKTILLRLDLNVPIKNGKIRDATRIDKILPTLKFLIQQKSKIIILSHIGRPKGIKTDDLSLRPICQNLEKKLNKKIDLITEDVFNLTKDQIKSIQDINNAKLV